MNINHKALSKALKRVASKYNPGYYVLVYPRSGRVLGVFHDPGDAFASQRGSALVFRHCWVNGRDKLRKMQKGTPWWGRSF